MATSLALYELLYQLADEELLLGHRDSEWLGLAPHIELDVAFASIAQDEIGHASLYFRLLAEVDPAGRNPDALAFGRPAADRRNAILLERPNGPGHYLKEPRFDWAYTVVRHYLYDLFDAVRLEALAGCSYTPLSQAAGKIRREERYHLLHHEAWFKRLAHYGGESRHKLEQALIRIWPEVGGLFSLGPSGEEMVAQGFLPDGPVLLSQWKERLYPVFAEAGLNWSGDPWLLGPDGRSGEHTPDLVELLTTMTEVWRSEPEAQW